MIRISDLANAAAWARPVSTPARADAQDTSGWFSADAAGDVRLSADPGPESRGLSVEQHAGRVLAALCGERDGA